VEFQLVTKSGKTSASNVKLLPAGTIAHEQLVGMEYHDGLVLRPMKSLDKKVNTNVHTLYMAVMEILSSVYLLIASLSLYMAAMGGFTIRLSINSLIITIYGSNGRFYHQLIY